VTTLTLTSRKAPFQLFVKRGARYKPCHGETAQVRRDQPFKVRQFTAEVILWAPLAKGSVRRGRMEEQGEGLRWYLMFPISYRDLELMLLDRGVEVDHTTIFR
jgi:transposase, IS6 family